MLRIRPGNRSTRLRLVARAQPDRPLSGYDLYASADQAARSTFIDRSDWQGSVEVPSGTDPLQTLFVNNGGQLLARLPLVPGEYQDVTVMLPDDLASVWAAHSQSSERSISKCALSKPPSATL